MTNISAWKRPSSGVVTFVIGALLLTAIGEGVAIRSGSVSLALLIVFWYGAVFCWLAWFRPPLALIGLVVALPLITVEVGFGDVERTVSTDKIALTTVVVVWLVRRYAAAWSMLIRLQPGRWWIAFLVVVLMSALSNGTTVGQAWGFFKQFLYACLFLMVLDILDGGHVHVRRLLVAASLTGVGVASLSLVEWWLSRVYGYPLTLYFKHGTMMDWWAPGSTIAHRNFLAGYLVLVLPVLAALAFAAQPKVRGLLTVGAFTVALALLYARSMGASIGLVVAGLLAVGLVSTGAFPLMIRRASVCSFAAIILIAVAVIVPKLTSESIHLSARLATYRVGFAAISERPLLGYGANGYPRQWSRLETKVFGRVLVDLHESGVPVSAHSSFIDVAVERGLLGLITFATLLASLLSGGIKMCFRSLDLEIRVLLLGLVVGMTGFIVQAFTENLFAYSKVAAIFWILAAAVVRLAEPDKVE